jgi:MFS transporter, FHS family, L-fucose permease
VTCVLSLRNECDTWKLLQYQTQIKMTASSQDSSHDTPAAAAVGRYTGALITVTTLFFMWGFLTALNDILVPHLKPIFDLNYKQVILVQFAFFSAYFLFSIPSGVLIDRVGYKRAMVTGLAIMSFGAAMFVPAAKAPSFPLFLAALLALGAGITLLQVAANPYVTVLGPAKTASSRLNLTQAFNSLGTTIAPYFGSMLILSSVSKPGAELQAMSPDAFQAYRLQQASSVILPYIGLSLTLLVLAVIIAAARLPGIPQAVRSHTLHESGASVWKQRHLVLGAVAIFTYVGAEVAIGSFLVNYFGVPAIGGLAPDRAARLVSLYWFGAMVGRFIGAWVLRYVRTGIVLAFNAVAACALVLFSVMSSGHLAIGSILLVGLFNSIMFPSIFALGVAELGPLTGDGSGVLNMAIVGGAVIPLLAGALADKIGIQHAFVLPAACYLYILYYALRGSRPTVVARA